VIYSLKCLYNRVKNKLRPRIRTFREITFFMLCVTRIFKSNFECLRWVIYYELKDLGPVSGHNFIGPVS
jgi:hypothetical protein